MITSPNAFVIIYDRLVTHLQSLGIFDIVFRCEPKSAPGNGLTVAVYTGDSQSQGVTLVQSFSGLNTVVKRVVFSIRIHMPMLHEPIDDIEPDILGATELVIDSLSGDLDLGSDVTSIDLFGAYGTGMTGRPGYITIDSKIYRVMTLVIPVILESEATQG